MQVAAVRNSFFDFRFLLYVFIVDDVFRYAAVARHRLYRVALRHPVVHVAGNVLSRRKLAYGIGDCGYNLMYYWVST